MRRLTPEEKALIVTMVRGLVAERSLLSEIDEAFVEEMQDGGMGSLRFVSEDASRPRFGKQICEATFHDEDDISVSIVINVDHRGRLLELDIFKADLSPLKKLPNPSDLRIH